MRYIRWQDQTSSLLGKLLILESLKPFNNITARLSDLKFSQYKRPYFDWEGDFNLSHSGEWVICAASDRGKIGVDIEAVRPVEFDHFSDHFTATEWERIDSAPNPTDAFFFHWTAKESVVKADGRGLYKPLKSIQVENGYARSGDAIWHINQCEIADGYICNLSSSKPFHEIEYRQILPEEIAQTYYRT